MPINIEPFPAFGFDTFTRSNAMFIEGARKEKVELTDDAFKGHVNGYMTYGIARNIAKGLAYIPLVNIIIGIVSIVFMAKGTYFPDSLDPAYRKKHVPAHIGRIICDICLGPLMAIVDLIKTLVEQHQAKKIIAAAA